MNDSIRIATRETGMGEYRLSIETCEDWLYLHESVDNPSFHLLCEGIWIHEYPPFRDAYLSLKGVQQGILCVNDDFIPTTEDGHQQVIQRVYLARKGTTWTIYDVGMLSLRQMTMTTEDLDKIIERQDAFLKEEQKEGKE